MICYHDADLQKAITRIKQATAETNSLIIEQKIEEKANYCVQFAYSEIARYSISWCGNAING